MISQSTFSDDCPWYVFCYSFCKLKHTWKQGPTIFSGRTRTQPIEFHVQLSNKNPSLLAVLL